MIMIERVARAISNNMCEFSGEQIATEEEWNVRKDDARQFFEGVARAAITAMREPTPEMITAVREIGGPQAAAYALAAWPTMIDAAMKE